MVVTDPARILVVDDDDDVRQLVSTVLMEEGHKVQVAADGSTALEAMKADPPDVLILDIMMPKIDGYTVLRKMQDEGLKELIKVLILTAKATEADWLRGYELGADHYLTKPFTVDQLTDAVTEVLTMTPDDLEQKRTVEVDKAQLLARLESMLDG